MNSKPSYRILHADDDPTIHTFVGTFIEAKAKEKPYRLEYIQVNDGEEFIEHYSPDFAVLITDEQMPKKNGIDAILNLHEQKKLLSDRTFMYCTFPSNVEGFQMVKNLGIKYFDKTDYDPLIKQILSSIDEAHQSRTNFQPNTISF